MNQCSILGVFQENMVLKNHAETPCTHEEYYAKLIRMFNECRYVGVETPCWNTHEEDYVNIIKWDIVGC